MLRPLKTPNLGARLLAFTATTAGSAANTVGVGAQEGTFTNAVADEQLDLVFKQPFSRAPIVLASPGAGVGDGGVAFAGSPVVAGVSVSTLNSSGSSDVGTVHGLVLGWNNSSTRSHGGKNTIQYPVFGSFNRARMIIGQVAAAGTVNIGGTTFTSVKNSAGNYTITFSRAFGRTPVGLATVISTTKGYSHRIEAISKNSVNILTFNDSSAAADAKFNFVIYGSDSVDEYAMERGGQIDVGFRKSRLLPFQINYTAGTPSLAIGDDLGEVADTGVGLATITYEESFAREPVVIVTSGDETPDWFATINSSDGEELAIDITDAVAASGDPDSVFVLVFGSDDATEY